MHFAMLLGRTLKHWFRDGAFDRSAVLAYCAVFSIAPLLVLITYVVALFHQGDTIEQVRVQFADFVSPAVADLIAKGVVNAGFAAGRNIVYTTFAGLMMIVGASAFTYELQRAVDVMWQVKPQSGKRHALLRRFWTLVLGVGMGILLQMSVVLNSEASTYRDYVNAAVPAFVSVWHWVDNAISFSIIAVIYCLSYKLLPRMKVAWRDAAKAALVASVLFVLGRWVVALYMLPGGSASVYGAAGSLMVLLTWLYYCSLVFLFGAKFTKTCADDRTH
jgi:membrane protein